MSIIVILYRMTIKITIIQIIGECCVSLMSLKRTKTSRTSVVTRSVCPTIGTRIDTMPPWMTTKYTVGGVVVVCGIVSAAASLTTLTTTLSVLASTPSITCAVLNMLHVLNLCGESGNLGD